MAKPVVAYLIGVLVGGIIVAIAAGLIFRLAPPRIMVKPQPQPTVRRIYGTTDFGTTICTVDGVKFRARISGWCYSDDMYNPEARR